jgi:hypothetical protein
VFCFSKAVQERPLLGLGLESITYTTIQVTLQSTIPMDLLSFSRSWTNTQEAVAMRVEKLNQASVDETTSGLEFKGYPFDEDIIVRAVIDLLHRAFQKDRQFGCLQLYGCRGRIDEILNAASSLDMFDEIAIFGRHSELSHHAFWSISAAMKFNKRLTKLHLQCMELTRHQAAALGAGLITSNSQHFKELRMPYITFADGATTELASGLKQNSSICLLDVYECNLGDDELAELIDAVESHPSLKKLLLRRNAGQKHTLAALGKVLASSKCQLEELDFSDQGIDQSGLTGWLGILAQGLRWNESLTCLDLSNNGLLDKDVDHLGQIVLATCQLETLDLSYNEITHSGFVSLTKNIPKSLKSFDFSGNCFGKEEAACHILTLFEEHHPQLWEDGFDWEDSKSPIHKKIQHFKDLNRCGRILFLTQDGAIPLSVWPIVLARANASLRFASKERTHNAIFHLLQGPSLMQRRFDIEASQQVACVGVSERLPTSSKLGPAEMID